MTKRTVSVDTVPDRAKAPRYDHAREVHPYGRLVKLPIALPEDVCQESAANLTQLLADTFSLRDLYKKHHWQVAGPTFYSLHLLFDKHYGEQNTLVDAIAERIQLLGGVSLAMAHDVAETTMIPRPAKRARRRPGAALAVAGGARSHPRGGAGHGAARRGAS